MSLLDNIKKKEQQEYKDMPNMIKYRKRQIKDVQIMREAKGQSKNKPAKIILPCINCCKPKEFFKDEVINICKGCMI